MMSELKNYYQFSSNQRLEICFGDLTQEKVDAIVNAANSQLMHGGGIAAVISHRGGPAIDQQSRDWVKQHGPVSHEKPAITGAGKLPSRYVIHAVGPVWGSGREEEKLTAAIKGCLIRAEELSLTSIAFPAISTGIFHFPTDLAARIFFKTFQAYFVENTHSSIQLIRIVLFDVPTQTTFLNEFSLWRSALPA